MSSFQGFLSFQMIFPSSSNDSNSLSDPVLQCPSTSLKVKHPRYFHLDANFNWLFSLRSIPQGGWTSTAGAMLFSWATLCGMLQGGKQQQPLHSVPSPQEVQELSFSELWCTLSQDSEHRLSKCLRINHYLYCAQRIRIYQRILRTCTALVIFVLFFSLIM